MRALFLLACGLLASVAARADTLTLSTRAEAFAEPVSIDAFTSGWHDELKHGDDAALHARLDLRSDHGPWHVAWRWRYDYQLEFSSATALLHHRLRNELPVEAGRSYPLDIDAYHSERHGLGLGYRLDHKPFQLELSLNLYQGLSLIEGQTRGHGVFASNQLAGDQLNDLLLRIDYRYSEPELHEEELDWHPEPPDGWGYGLDLGAQWTSAAGTELRLQIDDLFGEMHWRYVPATGVTARCNCTLPSYDINGGLRMHERYRQRLKPYAELIATHPLSNDWQLGARLLHDTWLAVRQFGVERQMQAHRLGLWYEVDYHAWRLAYQHSHARLSWTADHLDTSEAHRLGVDLTLFWRW